MLKDTGRLAAALDTGFTPLQMFSELLILQISVQQDTQPPHENPGLSLPGLGQLLMCSDSVRSTQIPLTKLPAFPTTDSALVGFVGLE